MKRMDLDHFEAESKRFQVFTIIRLRKLILVNIDREISFKSEEALRRLMSEASSTEKPTKRPQFGNRFLPKSAEDAAETVFQHNAW